MSARQAIGERTGKHGVGMFSGIVNKEVEVPRYSEGPYLKTRVDIVPVKDKRSLYLQFPVPNYTEHYETKVGFFLVLLKIYQRAN